MSNNHFSWLKESKGINYLEDSDDTNADPDYVDCCYNNVIFNVFYLKYL